MTRTNVQDLRLTTARLYWLPRGETSGHIDFGNVTSYKRDPDRARASHFSSRGGRKVLDFELIKSNKERWTLMLDEHFNETLKLLAVGRQIADTLQNPGVGIAVSILLADLAHGRVYDFGRQQVSNVAGLRGATPLVEDVDYELDAGAGLLTILPEANLSADWDFTFNCPLLSRLSFTSLNALFQRGTFRLVESDQLEAVPVNVEEFSGQVYVSGWGEDDLDKFHEFKLEVLVT